MLANCSSFFLQNEAQIGALRDKKARHREFIKNEKGKYYHHRNKARKNQRGNNGYTSMSIIIDGMDQAKTKLPNPVRHSKDTEPLFQQAVHVTGILNHGGKVPALVLLEDGRATKDANNTINSLCHTLRQQQLVGPLPEVLYIQLDNATGENKNRFVLFFCALLVGAGVVKKVKLSFLPVGHTHEDIDQLFSRFAEALRRQDCYTWDDLERIVRGSYTSSNGAVPNVVRNPHVPDFKGWMAANNIKMSGHTGPMCFRFTKNDDDDVVMFARGRTSVNKVNGQPDEDSTWFPEDGYVVVSAAEAAALWKQDLFRVPARILPFDAIAGTIARYGALGIFDAKQLDEWKHDLLEARQDVDGQCSACSELREEEALTNQVTLPLSIRVVFVLYGFLLVHCCIVRTVPCFDPSYW